MFFLVFLTFIGLLYLYVGRRLISASKLPKKYGRPAWGLILVSLFSPPLALYLRLHGVEGWYAHVLAWAAYLSLGFMSLMFFFVLARDLIGLTAAAGWKILGGSPMSSFNAGRRRFLLRSTNLALTGLGLGVSGYGFFQARQTPRIEDVTVPIKNLPQAFEGFRFVQVTDLHVGPTIGGDFVRRVVDRVKEMAPDAFLVTGDLVDGRVPALAAAVAPLAEIEAPHGKYFVTGNHEYYSGVGPWVEELGRLGYDVLNNEHRVLERGGDRLVLAGVTDVDADRFGPQHASDPAAALGEAPGGLVRVLMAHRPQSIFEANEVGCDLQISGHTHGGQYFPVTQMVGLREPYSRGLHLHNGTYVYVSRGTGYWGPPLRWQSPSEITRITLTRAV